MAEQELKHHIEQYSICRCSFPRHCSTYNTIVDGELIKLCQSFTPEQRMAHACITDPELINKRLFNSYGYDQKWYSMYCILNDKTYYDCPEANKNQVRLTDRIIKLSEQLQDINVPIDNIEILCVGHYEKQFRSIKDTPYLKKINLTNIDAGEFSGNEWAESRAFASKTNLFSEDKEFIGIITASWNEKFIGERIDSLEAWATAKCLLSTTDGVVLCADTNCSCQWYEVCNVIFQNNEVVPMFESEFGISMKHVRVPYCNQFIAHRSIVYKYLDYLKEENIFPRMKEFVRNKILPIYPSNPVNRINRSEAWLMEMLSCYWWSNQDYLFVPSGVRNIYWYSWKNVKARDTQNI